VASVGDVPALRVGRLALDEFTLGPHGTHFNTGAGCWWRLTWVESGRAVLTGWELLGTRAATGAERPAPPETEESRVLREGLGSLAAERGEELTFTVACERGP
jgi:hypothetical protein